MNTTEPNIQAEDSFSSPYVEGNSEPQGNVFTGILGAILFSFIGVALWFGVYQLGYVAGLTGVIMIFATMKGYKVFGKKINIPGRIICIVISIIMIIASEIVCLGFEIYKAYQADYTITVLDAFGAIPDFLSDPQVMAGVTKDLTTGLGLALAVFLWSFFSKSMNGYMNSKRANALHRKK